MLYCTTCKWYQDEFWSRDGYSPLDREFIQWLNEKLLGGPVISDDCPEGEDPRKYVARELRKIAANIENMRIRTFEEWQQVRDTFKCPNCGSTAWGMD